MKNLGTAWMAKMENLGAAATALRNEISGLMGGDVSIYTFYDLSRSNILRLDNVVKPFGFESADAIIKAITLSTNAQ